MGKTTKLPTKAISIPTKEFLKMLNRALHTLDPDKWPDWAKGFVDISTGIKETDECVVVIFGKGNNDEVQSIPAVQQLG